MPESFDAEDLASRNVRDMEWKGEKKSDRADSKSYLDDLDPPEMTDSKLQKETKGILEKFPDVRDAFAHLLSKEEFDSLRLSFAQSNTVLESNPPQYRGALSCKFQRGGKDVELEEMFGWVDKGAKDAKNKFASEPGKGTFRQEFNAALNKIIRRIHEKDFSKEPNIDFDDDPYRAQPLPSIIRIGEDPDISATSLPHIMSIPLRLRDRTSRTPISEQKKMNIPEKKKLMQSNIDAIQWQLSKNNFNEKIRNQIKKNLQAIDEIYSDGAWHQDIIDMRYNTKFTDVDGVRYRISPKCDTLEKVR